jgi:hypothetical protein
MTRKKTTRKKKTENLPAETSAGVPARLDPEELNKATQVTESETIWLSNTTKGFDWEGKLVSSVTGRTLRIGTYWLAFIDGKRQEPIPFDGDINARPGEEYKLRAEHEILTPDGYRLGIRWPEYSYKKVLAPYLKSVAGKERDLSKIGIEISCGRKTFGEITFAMLTITELGDIS